MDIAPAFESLLTITSVSGSGSRGFVTISRFSAIPFVFIWLLPALAVAVVLIAAYLAYIWPESFVRSDKASSRKRPPIALRRCRVCGYDLRASPEYCPECGTPWHRLESLPPRRVAWVVRFHAGKEVNELHVPTDQLPILRSVAQDHADSVELLFALSERRQRVVASSEVLVRQADESLLALHSAGASPLLCSQLRHLRRFAHKHAYGRIEREVGPRLVALPASSLRYANE